MTDRTDRHCRFFHLLLTRRTRLYTKMVTTGALIHGDVPRHLGYASVEHPVALQLGGSEHADLAHYARIVQACGYGEVSLNYGCPNMRVDPESIGIEPTCGAAPSWLSWSAQPGARCL
jgi:tRNA-dihydrouridine synthase A